VDEPWQVNALTRDATSHVRGSEQVRSYCEDLTGGTGRRCAKRNVLAGQSGSRLIADLSRLKDRSGSDPTDTLFAADVHWSLNS
jgi:hypothetical protein